MIKLDPSQCEEMASWDCTLEEIARGLGVSISTLDRRRKEDSEFDEAIARGRARIRMTLRKAQLKSAIKEGNPSMLKWMGIQMLGQTDKHDIKHEGEVHIHFDKQDENA